MVTLKQIAAVAGVTEATASLAMRNCQRISRVRREAIQKIARDLGYQRNAHVSSLMRYIRNGRDLPEKATLAVLLAHPEANARKTLDIVETTCSAAEQRAAQMGYRSEFFWYNDPAISPQRLNQILISRGIQGVIVMAFRACTVELDWKHFAVVATNYTIPHPPLHRVHGDIYVSTKTILEQLWSRGYRRIGIASPVKDTRKEDHSDTLLYSYISASYLQFMAERLNYQFHKTPRLLLQKHLDKKIFLDWYDREKPDAVVTMDWDLLEWMRQHGVRVPEDAAFVALNYAPRLGDCAGIDTQPEIIGRTAAEMVIEQLENNEFGVPLHPKIVSISGKWHEGKTIRPPHFSL